MSRTRYWLLGGISNKRAGGEDRQVQFAEPGALTPEDFAAVQRQLRTRVLRWFAGSSDAAF